MPKKNYYRMASEVDTSVGTVLRHIEREGQLDNTLVIFTTDNGNFHAEHGLADKWYPHQERYGIGCPVPHILRSCSRKHLSLTCAGVSQLFYHDHG